MNLIAAALAALLFACVMLVTAIRWTPNDRDGWGK